MSTNINYEYNYLLMTALTNTIFVCDMDLNTIVLVTPYAPVFLFA